MMRSIVSSLFGVLAAAALAVPGAWAADLPPLKLSSSNAVPECVTPGRLMAFVAGRNKRLDPRYAPLAAEYMRHGQTLGVRWDVAFFQMLLETGNLTYTGDVKPQQNNFAGIAATGGGVRGESFSSISDGVLAHLQHVLIYAGERVENPIAERTRKVQEWKLVEKSFKGEGGPRTYGQIAKLWAAGSPRYSRDIASIADDFMNGPCRGADPEPGPAQEARGDSSAKTPDAEPPAPAPDGAPETGTRPVAEAPPPSGENSESPKAVEPAPVDRNAAAPESGEAAPAAESRKADAASGLVPSGSCRVWTASYGGSKAIIIKALLDKTTNYTVLDVNEGKEKREAEAYIAAYAKGGETVGEFASQTQALDKAFELCPEGSPPQ